MVDRRGVRQRAYGGEFVEIRDFGQGGGAGSDGGMGILRDADGGEGGGVGVMERKSGEGEGGSGFVDGKGEGKLGDGGGRGVGLWRHYQPERRPVAAAAGAGNHLDNAG